jgi:hypothetical protein
MGSARLQKQQALPANLAAAADARSPPIPGFYSDFRLPFALNFGYPILKWSHRLSCNLLNLLKTLS